MDGKHIIFMSDCFNLLNLDRQKKESHIYFCPTFWGLARPH